VAIASAVASASKVRCVPVTASPVRVPSAAWAASQSATPPGSIAAPRSSKPSSASGWAVESVSNSRSRSTRNSRSSNSRWIWSRSHGRIAQGVRGLGQRHILDQLGQLPVEHHRGQVGPQRLADLAAHGVGLVDQLLQRAVLGDPLGGGLLPDARDAGQVVAGVAAQRGEVRVLRRGQPVLGLPPPRG
jgi:hypothetical protein